MHTSRFVANTIRYFWRTDLAVILGVVAAAAALTGALIVGDSVRESLRRLTLLRLGNVDFSLVGSEFFTEDAVARLANQPDFAAEFKTAAPAVVVTGSFNHTLADDAGVLRAGNVNLFGLDDAGWSLLDSGGLPVPQAGQVVVNARLAEELQVAVGDELTLWLEIPSTIPRDSLLGDREETTREALLQVTAVLAETVPAGRFAIHPSQQLERTAFVALPDLQGLLDVAAIPGTPRNPESVPGRVNAVFVQANSSQVDRSAADVDLAARLTTLTDQAFTLTDYGVRVVPHSEQGYASVESRQMILSDRVADAAIKAAQESKRETSRALVYLVNEFHNAADADRFSMYSIIAGIDFAASGAAPFGPWHPIGDEARLPQADDEILLNAWLAEDLGVSVGDAITVKYHEVTSHGELPEQERTFQVVGIVPLTGPAADRGLTPDVPGITDAETFGDWEQPFEMDLDRVTTRDEEYWDEYRATPKAFVTLKTAQTLWGSRYGNLTSVRVATQPATADEYVAALDRTLTPQDLGIGFQPIKFAGLQAAAGTTDFSGLFLGFSFFVILSAAILVFLLFRLGVEQRGRQLGLLEAIGLSRRQVQSTVFAEGAVLIVIGSVLGQAAAIGYAAIMIHGLRTWWVGAIGTSMLILDVRPTALLIGLIGTVLIAAISVWWSLRQLAKATCRERLAGIDRSMSEAPATPHGRVSVGTMIGLLLLVVVVGLLVVAFAGLLPSGQAFSGLSWSVVVFFVDGILLLTASLLLMRGLLSGSRLVSLRGQGLPALARLAVRNAARHRQRSLTTAALIASAVFVIVAVAAGQRNPAVESPDRDSGNGGFTLVAESTVPILFDLGTPGGRDEIGLTARLKDKPLAPFPDVMAFRRQPGENASCLNLYQTNSPTILGVPPAMIERGGFTFVDMAADQAWHSLLEQPDDGSIPVLGDMNTLMFSMHKGPGDIITIPTPDAAEPESELKVTGMFNGSVFQGVLMMSEANFQRLFPNRAGYGYFLIDAPLAEAPHTAEALETGLTDYGFDVEYVARRLAAFLAVQNTYLSTFQALGGLGLLLGTIGLGTVMLRNVLERRGELALLRALGFGRPPVAALVLLENAFLLLCGLASGTVSALLAMLPHLTGTGADVPWPTVLLLLTSVVVVGLLAAGFAVAAAVRMPVVSGLRSE